MSPDQLASEKPDDQDPHCFPLWITVFKIGLYPVQHGKGQELSIRQNLCKTATLQKIKNGFQYQLLLNSDQGEHSAILSTFIKLPFVMKIFVYF